MKLKLCSPTGRAFERRPQIVALLIGVRLASFLLSPIGTGTPTGINKLAELGGMLRRYVQIVLEADAT